MPKMNRVAGTRVDESSGFGFHEWGLEAREAFDGLLIKLIKEDGLIDKMIKEGLEIATADYKAEVFFDDDTMVMVVELPVGPNDMENPQWKVSLKDMVAWEIESCQLSNGRIPDGDEREEIGRLRNTFATLIGIIDEALAR